MADSTPLPWTDRHWDELRAVALEAARKSRVASTFLPLVGPFPSDQSTVPSNWLQIPDRRNPLTGTDEPRLEVQAGKTLQLVTLSCNLYLRGAEISDPDLDAAKSMVRRAGEVLGRLEDAVVFHGLTADERKPFPDELTIKPRIYTITGGRDLTGLLQCPSTLAHDEARQDNATDEVIAIQNVGATLRNLARQGIVGQALTDLEDAYAQAEAAGEDQLMCVGVGPDPTGGDMVDGVVDAIQRLEARGHFGPFAVVLGHKLFRAATTPTASLVLPTDRIAEFLDGRRVLRSGVLPPDRGVVVALGGQPIELVLANDIDVRFLQATLEPRYVLRVFERLVLRIKELDAVCGITSNDLLLTPGFVPRRALS
jgi:uncharacterized linocin/CFP29 family protein